MRRVRSDRYQGGAARERGCGRATAVAPAPSARRRLGGSPRSAAARRAEEASKAVDAAGEAIAYESCYEGVILEPADVDAAIVNLTGDIRQTPSAALAIASSGLSPSSSLLRDLDPDGPTLAERRASERRQPGEAAAMTMPLRFYGL